MLRRFELALLHELGYAVELAREAGAGGPSMPAREYWYVVERGPTARACDGRALRRMR